MSNKRFPDLTSIPSIATDDLVPMFDTSGNTTNKASVTAFIAGMPTATGSLAGTMSAADKTKLDAATSAGTASAIVQRDGSGNASFNVLTAAQVTVTGTPTNSTDATNKAYVDAVAVGLTIKAAVRAATVANVTLAGGAPSTLDGISLSSNDRILVKDQTSAVQNGIYTVTTVGSGSNGTWARATDADAGSELPTNSYVFVNSGTINGSTSWVMNTPGTITIGVSLIVWVLFSQITQIPAANITGQIVASQIADAFLTTAKFAASIRPVEIVSAMPTSGNTEGRTVYLTTVDGAFAEDKIYRWTNPGVSTGTTYWTSAVPAVDITGQLTNSQIADLAAAKLTGQITSTQITDGSISTPKLAAGSVVTAKLAASAVTANEISSGAVTTAKLAAGAVTANELAANSVVAGKIAAAAVNTTELAAGAVIASKIAAGTITTTQIAAGTILAGNIAAGTITADRMNVSTLSAIAANLGSVTAGTISTSVSITIGSGLGAVSITSGSGLQIAGGQISASGDGSNPWLRVFGTGGYSSYKVELNGSNGTLPPYFSAADNSATSVTISGAGVSITNNKSLSLASGSQIVGPGSILLNPGSGSRVELAFGEDPVGGTLQGYLTAYVNGRTVKIPFYI